MEGPYMDVGSVCCSDVARAGVCKLGYTDRRKQGHRPACAGHCEVH